MQPVTVTTNLEMQAAPTLVALQSQFGQEAPMKASIALIKAIPGIPLPVLQQLDKLPTITDAGDYDVAVQAIDQTLEDASTSQTLTGWALAKWHHFASATSNSLGLN